MELELTEILKKVQYVLQTVLSVCRFFPKKSLDLRFNFIHHVDFHIKIRKKWVKEIEEPKKEKSSKAAMECLDLRKKINRL